MDKDLYIEDMIADRGVACMGEFEYRPAASLS